MRQTQRILSPRQQRRRGSSLMEVLVSISILAVAAVILTQFSLRSLDENAMATRRAKAFLLAQERMEDILAHRNDLAGYEVLARARFTPDEEVSVGEGVAYRFQTRRGDLDLANNFRFTWAVSPVEGRTGLKEANVTVYWRQFRQTEFRQKTNLRTYVAVGPDEPAAPAEEGDKE